VTTREQWEALCETAGLAAGDLRSRTPRLRALASRLREAGLDDVAHELEEHARGLDHVRRALTARADATLSDTQPIDL
jgi:hypothetical protein